MFILPPRQLECVYMYNQFKRLKLISTFRTLDKGMSVYVAPGTGLGGGAPGAAAAATGAADGTNPSTSWALMVPPGPVPCTS